MSRLRTARDHDPLKIPYWEDELLNPRSAVSAKPLDEARSESELRDAGVDRAFEEADERIFVEQLVAKMEALG